VSLCESTRSIASLKKLRDKGKYPSYPPIMLVSVNHLTISVLLVDASNAVNQTPYLPYTVTALNTMYVMNSTSRQRTFPSHRCLPDHQRFTVQMCHTQVDSSCSTTFLSFPSLFFLSHYLFLHQVDSSRRDQKRKHD